jgi:hypothetical protein
MRSILQHLVSHLPGLFRQKENDIMAENNPAKKPDLFETDEKNYTGSSFFSALFGIAQKGSLQHLRYASLSVLMLFAFAESKAQLSITSTSTAFTQPFTIGTSATAAMPTGFKICTGGSPNWDTGATATTLAAGTSGTGALTGSSTGGTYNLANGVTASSTDRAVGFITSGSFASPNSIILKFTNNTGAAITSLNISFDYEKYRTGTRAWDMTFFHGSTTNPATAVTAGNQSYTADGANAVVNPPTTITKTITGLTVSIANGASYYLKWTSAGSGGSTNAQGIGLDNFSITAFGAAATPTITGAATTGAFTTTYGTASAAQNFSVSGADLTANLVATAPTGFEVSNDGTNYNTTATFTQSGGNASGTLRIRLKANAAVGTSIYNSKNITLTSTGATTVNITTAASGNAVNAKELLISGITPNNKVFDGSTAATLSGTPALEGVLSADIPNVTLGGTPIATFTSSAIGENIPVTITGYTISGSASGNYSLTQPLGLTANITSASTPVINSPATASATYGAAATPYFITASGSPTSFSADGLPNGLDVNASTGEISGTPLDFPGVYNVTISAGNGETGTAILAYTILAKPLTVSGASADDKEYDRTTTATISGSVLDGIVGSDDVTISNTATFANANAGTGIAVTSTQTLGGTDAVKYTLTLPTGLTADITPKALTIASATAQNKPFDGNTTATITGTLSGVISPDSVTLNLSGTFASSAIGNNIAVTSTSTITGSNAANYSLTQPTGLTANILSGPTVLAAGDIAIIGYNTNGSPDNFAILVLKDLNAGTVFYVNDNEVASAGGTSFTDLGEFEASFTVKSGQTIPAGTVIVLPWGQAAVSTTTYDWSTTSGAGLGNNNEELYIYTASAITSSTPTAFIYYAKIGTSTSAIPAGLTAGTTAISPSGSALRYVTSGALYVGCPSVLLAAIGNTATNWNTTGAASLAVADWLFTVDPVCRSISTTGTLAALSTTYGTPSSETSFDVSGTNLLAGITVTAPTGFEVSLTSGGTFTPSLVIGSAGNIPSTTVFVRLSGSATFGTYSGNIALTSSGTTTVNIATASSSVSRLTITTTGAVASNKAYDTTAAATITGAVAVGAIVSDGIAITGGGTFDSANIGTAKPVTAALTLTGSNTSSYILTQPTGLTADVTAVALTITGITANSKVFDGNTTATLSGTAALSGVLPADLANVVLGGTPVANFASSAVGTAIAVNVSGYTISGTASGNYTLTQPVLSADITSSPFPSITSVLTASAVYGTPAATYTITATETPTSFNATDLPSGLGVNTATGEITGTPTANPGSYNVTISATNAGGTGSAILVYTILAKELTISNAVADSKVYDRTTAATISGSILDGVFGSDDVTVSNTGTFASVTVGTAIAVTSTQTLSGADASKYTLTLPTGLAADITPKALTISSAVAQNKVFDGNTTAAITGTLSGVISPDAVTLNLSGTFAIPAAGNGIAVTSTSTITGADSANYTLTQPIGLTANIIPGPTTLAAGDIAIIGYNTSGSPDNIAILVLKELTSGTVFYVNDNEVTSAGGTSFADLGEAEASFTVKTGQTIPAGTVIVLPWGQAAVSTATYDWSTTSGAGLGNNNEEIYLYTASGITATTPTAFIYYAKIGSSVGAIPAGLTAGTTAISPSGSGLRYATSGALYVGCPAALLAAIGNTTTNWNATGATTIAASDWTFTVEPLCRSIVATGTPSALSTTYGTPSAETSFDVSGSSLLEGILVTAPAGYELSLTSGGTFTPSVTVGAAGTVPATTVYVRLSGSAPFGTYSGNIVLTSSGAPTVNVATGMGNVAKLTISTTGAMASNKVYDRTTAATITGAVAVGAIGSDGITISGGGVFDSANVGTAIPVTAALALSGLNTSSYILTQPTGLSADITAATLTIAGVSANNKEYDANSSATLSGTLSGVIAPDNVTLIKSAGFATATVGTAKPVTSTSFVTGSDIGNYIFIQPTGLSADITPKALTIADATALNKVFDGNTTATITGTLSGVIEPDNVVLNLSGTFATSAVGTGIAVTSTSTITGGDASNYTLTQPLGLTANITSGALTPQTITFNPLADVVYGDTVTLNATASSGLPVSYESLNPAIATISGNVLTTLSVGTVTIKATQAGDGTFDTAPFVTQTLTITPKALNATATANNKVYDGNEFATISATLNGVVGADVVNFVGTGIFVSSNVGTGIEVISTASIDGTNASNYTLAPLSGLSADITPKSLTIVPGTAVADNKIYDGTDAANITGGDLVGVIGADEVYILDTFGTFNNANVGTAKPVTAALTIDGASALNYILTQPTGLTANITAVALTVGGLSGVDKVYDATTAATVTGTPVLSGILGSDDVTLTGTPSATFATKTVGNAKVITVTGYSLSGTQAGNYSLPTLTGITANITPASLTIAGAAAQNKTFDGSTDAVITGSLAGALGTDVVTLIGTGTFASSAIGTGIAVTSTATVGGADGANYIINPQPSGLSANITAGLQFTQGRLVVARVGLTGQPSAPTSAATATFLDEYTTTGATGISVALPTTSTSTINRITESGSATSEVQLNLSANGQYLVLGGYDLAAGTASANNAANPRVIARVNNFGTVATLPIGATHTSGFRSATSTDGTRFWTAGNGNGVTTVPFTTSTVTPATPTTIYTGATNLRTVSIFNNQLYFSTGSGTNGIYKVGTGTPTTAGQTATNIIGLADVYAYSMVNRGGSNWNMYAVVGNSVAANQGIYKYSSTDNGATWTANGSIKPTTAPTFGITAAVNGSNVDIYATTATGTASTILKVTDSAAFNANLTGTPTVLVTAPANTFFRGIAFAPVEPVSAAVLTGNAVVCEGASTNLNVAITGGVGPFKVVYNNGVSDVTVSNYTSGTNIAVVPLATTTYTLVSVTDAYGYAGSGISGIAEVTVNPNTTYYADADGDTFGDPASTAVSCTGAPSAYVASNTDCAPADGTQWQSGLLYIDADGDGWDSGQQTVCYGATIPTGYAATTSGTDCDDNDNTKTDNCSTTGGTINLTMAIQGYYLGGGMMNSVMMNQGASANADDVEMMTVELRDATDGSMVESTTAMLHTDGSLSAVFTTAPAASYYIAVKGRNIVETWSAAPQALSSTALDYDFTSSASQAYGDNMAEVEPGVYGFFSGEFNADGFVEFTDYTVWETDANNFAEGDYATDLNGDGFVEFTDYTIWEGNANNFVGSFLPF